MKRLIITALTLLTLVALVYWGNRIIEKTLDAELPPLLTRALGIPVTLGPSRARLSNLTVTSPELVMGDPANPALLAREITISLDWADLLRGELRLRWASAATLMIKPSLWPSSDNPLPDDYRFLDPYLPDYLQLDSASYVSENGDSQTFNHAIWRRQSPAATLDWQQDLQGKALHINANLQSLDDVLQLARMQTRIIASAADADDYPVEIDVALQRGEKSGYLLSARVDAAGMTAQVSTGNDKSWELPDQSTTTIKQLDIKKLQALIAAFNTDTSDAGVAEFLASTLPRLSLPTHQGKVNIDEIRWKGEVGTNSSFDFVTGPKGIKIPVLSSEGPEGVLNGQVNIISSDSGWQIGLSVNLHAANTDSSIAAPYLNADWFWREGNGTISGEGKTWGALLNSLQGDIKLSGSHRGTVKTPVSISASLDKQAGQFALEKIEIKLEKGSITGSVALAGDKDHRLTGGQPADITWHRTTHIPAAVAGS